MEQQVEQVKLKLQDEQQEKQRVKHSPSPRQPSPLKNEYSHEIRNENAYIKRVIQEFQRFKQQTQAQLLELEKRLIRNHTSNSSFSSFTSRLFSHYLVFILRISIRYQIQDNNSSS